MLNPTILTELAIAQKIDEYTQDYQVTLILDEDDLHDTLLNVFIDGVKIEDSNETYNRMVELLPLLDIKYINRAILNAIGE